MCPSILFQVGGSGLRSHGGGSTGANAADAILFKKTYTILIQLTALIGGLTTMIPVFEAIYQRIFYYTPELDRHLLLKLFKSVSVFPCTDLLLFLYLYIVCLPFD